MQNIYFLLLSTLPFGTVLPAANEKHCFALTSPHHWARSGEHSNLKGEPRGTSLFSEMLGYTFQTKGQNAQLPTATASIAGALTGSREEESLLQVEDGKRSLFMESAKEVTKNENEDDSLLSASTPFVVSFKTSSLPICATSRNCFLRR
ncbi:Hypothetical predicted protein [Podarcis lilfordi]|uniref:Secreted protein n=1 Tax=Podarcis lilfordi TaxID=74358 RepID=A0AA35L2W4_9SAUR|nr:Hypothetical predicted protein [Podarcis lilfordi]